MAIREINIKDYSVVMGKNRDEFSMFRNTLPTSIRGNLQSLNINKIDVYNLNKDKHDHKAGRKNERLVIFGNATMRGAGDEITLEEPELINGIENDITTYLSPTGNGIVLLSGEGRILAEWYEDTYELNILFDVFGEYNENNLSIFDYIMKEFNKVIWFPKTLENSWVYTQNKEQLTSKFTQAISRTREAQLRDDKTMLARNERELNDARRRMKMLSDTIIQRRIQIEATEASINNVTDGLIKDLDLIVQHDKIKDLHIRDNKFIVYTKPLIIHSDKGDKYYGGEYTIEINPDSSDIRFFGETQKRGYWTLKDAHPHVSGATGEPCLGNVSSTIAELCSQMQIYALVMVCIDFLESANTSDVAGARVVNWDRVDDDGNIIITPTQRTEDNRGMCPICGEHVGEDYLLEVCDTLIDDTDEDGDGEYYGTDEIYVCEECREEYYHYDDMAECYISDEQ